MTNHSQSKITVLLADDHLSTRVGVRTMLIQANDIVIVGEARDGNEIKQKVSKLRPKILLLDLKMPESSPAELEKWIRENYPETITLVLTAHDRDSYLVEMMDAGVAGYLHKEETASRLINAIRRAAQGIILFDAQQISRAQNWRETIHKKWESLTGSERKILRLIAQGEDNKTIATVLSVSPKTVEFHISHILEKLDLPSRQKVVVWMLRNFPDELEE